MRRLAFGIAVVLLALAAVSQAAFAVSAGTQLRADILVAQVGPASPIDPTPVNFPDAHIKVRATDVDPSPPTCDSCPTADDGSIVYDSPGYQSRSGHIDWIDVQSDGSVLVSAGGYAYHFVDGGRHGDTVIGPPGPTGVPPTLDSVTVVDFAGVGPFLEGWLRRGEITIRGHSQRAD